MGAKEYPGVLHVTEADTVRRIRELAQTLRDSIVGQPFDLSVMACLDLALQILKEAHGLDTMRAMTQLLTTLEQMQATEARETAKVVIS